jgi:CO/xanthine dehydrogenase FAD-binding subunit
MALYLRPTEVEEAVSALAANDALTILAGGTDLYPARVARPAARHPDVLDITALRGLRGITDDGDRIRIGAATTWSDIVRGELPPWLDGLKRAARDVGGVQIQNAGTVAGNVCNASPAADGMPSLLALDAAIELVSHAGRRTLPLDAFVTGNRRTARRPDELVTAILVPKPRRPARATFLKLGARRYLVISIAMVGAVIEVEEDGSKVAAARVAVGACSPVARRLPALEAALAGRPLSPALGEVPEPAHLAPLSPIDDPRGTAEYRADAALTLVRRALRELAGP